METYFSCNYKDILFALFSGWFDVAVTAFVMSTKLCYVELG